MGSLCIMGSSLCCTSSLLFVAITEGVITLLLDSILEGLCAPWKEFFVVKLLGKNIGFTTMHDRLARAWKMPGGFEVLGLGNGYFMVKFDKDEDRKKSH